jgi:hypothetical protein
MPKFRRQNSNQRHLEGKFNESLQPEECDRTKKLYIKLHKFVLSLKPMEPKP